MPDVNPGDRPLSPFMIGQYYRPQWTSMTSIFVRITGNALLVTALLIVWWFAALARGEDAFNIANAVLTSWFGDVVMFLSVWGIWYHMLGGIRHLIWDSGHMLDVHKSEMFGQAMVIVSVMLAVFTAVAI